MKLALALLPAVSAFMAPLATQPASSLKASPYESELGVIAPTGFFDPAKLSNTMSPDQFALYREAELKHGRVCMLCVLGYIVPEVVRFPGEISPGLKFADVPNGVKALSTIPTLGLFQIIALIGVVDYSGFLGDFDFGKRSEADLPGGLLEERKLQELQHGRLAMIAVLELFRHDFQNNIVPEFDGLPELITGLPFLYPEYNGLFWEGFYGISGQAL